MDRMRRPTRPITTEDCCDALSVEVIALLAIVGFLLLWWLA
jgi:hypothetical protein